MNDMKRLKVGDYAKVIWLNPKLMGSSKVRANANQRIGDIVRIVKGKHNLCDYIVNVINRKILNVANEWAYDDDELEKIPQKKGKSIEIVMTI
jgi:hypothetical protein